MTRDEFEYNYECPWLVQGRYLDDIECIHYYYAKLMMECETIPEMMGIVRQFGPFAWDSLKQLNRLSNFWVEDIKELFKNKYEPTENQINMLSPIIVPHVMIQAKLIAKGYELPEFYAGLQYLRATMFEKEKENGNSSI